jgi:hypothetical protein
VLTRPTAPDSQPAPHVRPLPGGKTFIVTWNRPAEPNGIIFRYELHQRLFPALPDDRGKSVYTSSPSTNPGASNLRNATITGLVPFTWYEFRVVTYTAEVSGDTASNWTKQRTAEAGKVLGHSLYDNDECKYVPGKYTRRQQALNIQICLAILRIHSSLIFNLLFFIIL